MIEGNPTCQLRTKDLYRNEKVFSKTKKKYIQKKVHIFEINYKPDSKKIPILFLWIFSWIYSGI